MVDAKGHVVLLLTNSIVIQLQQPLEYCQSHGPLLWIRIMLRIATHLKQMLTKGVCHNMQNFACCMFQTMS